MNLILIILAICFFTIAVLFECSESREWSKFKKEHACKEIGQMDGSLDFNGDYTSGKIGYICNDGKQYWKNK